MPKAVAASLPLPSLVASGSVQCGMVVGFQQRLQNPQSLVIWRLQQLWLFWNAWRAVPSDAAREMLAVGLISWLYQRNCNYGWDGPQYTWRNVALLEIWQKRRYKNTCFLGPIQTKIWLCRSAWHGLWDLRGVLMLPKNSCLISAIQPAFRSTKFYLAKPLPQCRLSLFLQQQLMTWWFSVMPGQVSHNLPPTE